jgi:DNA-binding MarR family transcriptional regulator
MVRTILVTKVEHKITKEQKEVYGRYDAVKLENDGYVKRTVDPTDKRATLISLTELGEARAAELQDEKNEKLDKAFGNLTDDEKEQLIALLEKLTAEK